jgi:hypothetical protein
MLHVQQQFILPDINFFINKLRNSEPFNFCKLNHGFWECSYAIHENPFLEPRQISGHLAEGWLKLHGKEFLDEMLLQLSYLPQTRIMLGVSNKGTPSDIFEKGEKLYDFILSHFPLNYKLYFGPLMKYYVLNKTIHNLMRFIEKDYRILFVGLPHIQKINSFFQFKCADHLTIETDATQNRVQVLDQILTRKKDLVLFQAGESLSFWLSFNLQAMQPEVTSMDFGRALDNWCYSDQDYEFFPDIKNQIWKTLIR